MYHETNVYQYEYFREVDALCVTLCTDEPKYIDDDSHYIHIPKNLFVELTNKLNINLMCFEITNPSNPTKKIFVKKIVPSTDDFDKFIWLPNWICTKLNIQYVGDKINFVPIANPKEIKRIQIQGSSSSYIKVDIKNLLENKLEQFRCINLGEIFSINVEEIGDIKFEVKELLTKSNEKVRFGIISNELEIDFEMPEDLKLLEKKKIYIKSIINYKINQKIDERFEKELLEKKRKLEKKTGIFNFSKLLDEKKLDDNVSNPNQIVNLDEILDELVKKINSQDNNNNDIFKNIENPDNISILKSDIPIVSELIEQGKNIFKKLAEEQKIKNQEKNNINDCKDCCDNKINPNDNSKPIYFNTTAHKLSDSGEDSKSKLTPEEIRKLRLEKFKNL